MQYPFFNFPFYKPHPDIDLKRIYPIGSIIFRSSPLADKVEWTDVSKDDPHFTVQWEDMTWELIVDNIPSSDFYLAYTQVHTIRNCRLRLTATDGQIRNRIFNGKMIIDNQDVGTFNLDTFTGENSHQLIEEEMASHFHNLRWDGYNIGSGPNFIYVVRDGGSNTNAKTLNKGGDQPHNNKEYAYNLFMYKRIA